MTALHRVACLLLALAMIPGGPLHLCPCAHHAPAQARATPMPSCCQERMQAERSELSLVHGRCHCPDVNLSGPRTDTQPDLGLARTVPVGPAFLVPGPAHGRSAEAFATCDPGLSCRPPPGNLRLHLLLDRIRC